MKGPSDSRENYERSFPDRGTQCLYLDGSGQPTAASHAKFEGFLKHVFTCRYSGFKPLIDQHHVFHDWDPAWDGYIGDMESRRALAKLTGGALPNELYQIEILLQQWGECTGRGNGPDGPFLLTTDRRITTKQDLQTALQGLSLPHLNMVLLSSIKKTVK